MRGSWKILALLAVVASMSSPRAAAQVGCSELNAQGYRTCLFADERPQVGQTTVIEAYAEWPSQFQVFDTTFAIYLGENEIFNGRVDPITRRARVEVTFFQPGDAQILRALPGRGPVSNNVTVTPAKFNPIQTVSVSSASSKFGGKITLNTTTRLYRPSGSIVIQVLPPGASQWTTIAQKAANSTDPQFLDTDSREFAFAGPFNKPGIYRFSTTYLGDALNGSTQAYPWPSVQLEAFDPRLLLPSLNLLLED